MKQFDRTSCFNVTENTVSNVSTARGGTQWVQPFTENFLTFASTWCYGCIQTILK